MRVPTPPPARTHAATPRTMPPLARKDVGNLVRSLGASARPSQQWEALERLASLSLDSDVLVHLAAAGAIPPLVKLLWSADMQALAATSLGLLASQPEYAVTVSAAGAIPQLVQMLGLRSPLRVQQTAAAAMMALSDTAASAAVIVASGAIPRLVQLLGPGCAADFEGIVAETLGNLARHDVDNAVTISAAGAIPLLVQLLLEPSSTFLSSFHYFQVQRFATDALGNFACNPWIAFAIGQFSGAIPLFVQLLRPGSPAAVQQSAARSLLNLALVAANAPTIAGAGAIPLLAQLMPDSPGDMRRTAGRALSYLALGGVPAIRSAVEREMRAAGF
jgi:hypothetical protein